MGRLLVVAALLSLAGLCSSARPQRDDRRGEGQRRGEEKKEERREKNREVRGDEHRRWDYEHDRVRPGHAFPHGRYEHVRERFFIRRFDSASRRVFFPDGSVWVIAPYDIPRCRDWYWDRDVVYVYDDDTHPGWYVLFNVRLGHYIHVEYFGVG